MENKIRSILEVIKFITPVMLILISNILIDILNIIDYVMIKQIYILPLLGWLFVYFITIPETTK